jgi:hypothetical protein
MKFRVIDKNGKYFPTYFKTKKEATAYLPKLENPQLQRKIGGEWFPC